MKTEDKQGFHNSFVYTSKAFDDRNVKVVEHPRSGTAVKAPFIRSCGADAVGARTEFKKKQVSLGLGAQKLLAPLGFTGNRMISSFCNGKTKTKTPSRFKSAKQIESDLQDSIKEFVNDHQIDLEDFDKTTQYKTEDEFFARKLSKDHIRFLADMCMHNSAKEGVLVASPATGRTLFGTMEDLKTYWIKGKGETVGSILKCVDGPCQECDIDKWDILVTRLAPADYHRFHSPLSGTVTGVRHFPGESRSVDPYMVNSADVSVFSYNHRVIVEITPDDDDGSIYSHAFVVIVGASCVNSIRLDRGGPVFRVAPTELKSDTGLWEGEENKNGDTSIKMGDELGSFHYGGSTVLTLLCPTGMNKNHVHKRIHRLADITKQCSGVSCFPMELYTEVGVPIIKKAAVGSE
jgi:phosphatidylserine decarboxylase precursor